MSDSNSRLVYSTDGGRVKPQAPAAARGKQGGGKKQGPPARQAVPDDGVVRVMRDTKGRKGKTATVVTGLPGSETELDGLLKELKQACGAGGSREGRVLEIQGDHRERLVEKLTAAGHRVKLAGG